MAIMGNPLNRRSFITGAGAAAAAGVAVATSFPSPAIAYGKRQWKMAMAWQKVLPGFGTGAVRLAQRITDLSDGQLEVIPYGNSELASATEIFDTVSEGKAEMGHACPSYWTHKNRAAAFFCGLPGGLTAQEQNGWLYFGGGKKLWDELYGQFGLIAFAAGNTGCQMGGWFNREINSVSDFKDLKMRITGIAGEVFTKLGGNAQALPPQELYTAMQSGVIEALEWIGPWNDMSLGFHRVAKYYYGPSFGEGGATLELIINKKAFDELPANLQHVVRTACSAENDIMTAEYHANNIRALQELKSRYNVHIRRYPDKVIAAFFSASKEIITGIANDGDIEKRIYESYEQYRRYSVEMSQYTEMAFMQVRK